MAVEEVAVALEMKDRLFSAAPNADAGFADDSGVLPTYAEVEFALHAVLTVKEGPSSAATESGLLLVIPIGQRNQRRNRAIYDEGTVAGVARDVQPAAAEVDAEWGLGGGADGANDRAGGNGRKGRRRFGENDVVRPDLAAESPLLCAVLIVLGDGEHVGLEAEKMVLKIETELVAAADDHFVDHFEAADEGEFVVLGEGGAAVLVLPKDAIRGEADGQMVAEGLGFLEKLHMPRVENVVAAGNEDFFHGFKRWLGMTRKKMGMTSFRRACR